MPLKWLASWISERGRDDLHLRARPGRFRPAGGRADQPFAARIGADRRRQHAGDRRDRAVEAELAQHREAGERVMRDRADRRHQAERDRQIVMAAFLRQVGGREIDGDAARRQREARGDQRRAHPLAASDTALSGRPTMLKAGRPGATCTCTSTARASMPSNATVETRWTMGMPLTRYQRVYSRRLGCGVYVGDVLETGGKMPVLGVK